MKTFKCLLALCLLSIFVGCGDLPKNPPLTDEEPVLVIRVQPAGIPSQERATEELESLLKDLSAGEKEDDEIENLINDFHEHFDDSSEGRVFTALFDLMSDLKKCKMKNFFCVFEQDAFPSGKENARVHDPFVAFDVHGFSDSKIKSVEEAIENFNEDASNSGDREIGLYTDGGYMVTNFANTNYKYGENESEFLEDKFSDDRIKDWPKDIKKGLEKYQNCAISGVGRVPAAVYREMQEELKNSGQYDSEKAQAVNKAAKKALKSLKDSQYFAFGIDFMTKTVSVSAFMESREDAEELKENAVKFVSELLKLAAQEAAVDVDKKDIDKFVKDINISQSGNVVTCTASVEWLKNQKSFIKKWKPKDLGRSQDTPRAGVTPSREAPVEPRAVPVNRTDRPARAAAEFDDDFEDEEEDDDFDIDDDDDF